MSRGGSARPTSPGAKCCGAPAGIWRRAWCGVRGLTLWRMGWAWGAFGTWLGFVAASAFSRRIERATDREALRLGANGVALISGLVRLARLSHVPIRWSRWTGWFLTH